MDGISGGGRGKEWGEVGKFLAFWRVWYIPDDDSAGLRERESQQERERDAWIKSGPSWPSDQGGRGVPAVGLLCGWCFP
jgi:hypothetical protein